MLIDEPIYSIPEASKQTGLSPWNLWDQLKNGKLMRTKIAGKTFIRESELRKLIHDEINPERPKRTRSKKSRTPRTRY